MIGLLRPLLRGYIEDALNAQLKSNIDVLVDALNSVLLQEINPLLSKLQRKGLHATNKAVHTACQGSAIARALAISRREERARLRRSSEGKDAQIASLSPDHKISLAEIAQENKAAAREIVISTLQEVVVEEAIELAQEGKQATPEQIVRAVLADLANATTKALPIPGMMQKQMAKLVSSATSAIASAAAPTAAGSEEGQHHPILEESANDGCETPQVSGTQALSDALKSRMKGSVDKKLRVKVIARVRQLMSELGFREEEEKFSAWASKGSALKQTASSQTVDRQESQDKAGLNSPDDKASLAGSETATQSTPAEAQAIKVKGNCIQA